MSYLERIQLGVINPDGSVGPPPGLELAEWINSGDQELLASEEFNHGDWPFRFFIHVEYLDGALTEREMEEAGGDCCVSIYAVSPEAAGSDNLLAAVQCCSGWSTMAEVEDNLRDPEIRRRALYEMLIGYGVKAPLYSAIFWDDDLEEAKNKAKEELSRINMLFGFYMDRPCNQIGNSGWDFIAGNIGWR